MACQSIIQNIGPTNKIISERDADLMEIKDEVSLVWEEKFSLPIAQTLGLALLQLLEQSRQVHDNTIAWQHQKRANNQIPVGKSSSQAISNSRVTYQLGTGSWVGWFHWVAGENQILCRQRPRCDQHCCLPKTKHRYWSDFFSATMNRIKIGKTMSVRPECLKILDQHVSENYY